MASDTGSRIDFLNAAVMGHGVRRVGAAGDPGGREPTSGPKFSKGDSVKVKNVPPADHTRLPGHLRGKTGVVDKVYSGFYVYFCSTGPDGLGEPMAGFEGRFDPK